MVTGSVIVVLTLGVGKPLEDPLAEPLTGPTGKDCAIGIVTGSVIVVLTLGAGKPVEDPLTGPTGKD